MTQVYLVRGAFSWRAVEHLNANYFLPAKKSFIVGKGGSDPREPIRPVGHTLLQ